MRRLTADELLAVASELGANPTVDVSELVATQEVESVIDSVSQLLVGIVQGCPFDRRNGAIAVASIDLLARFNGQKLDLEPPDEVVAVIASVRGGMTATEVRRWLASRVSAHAPAARPRCLTCSMPLREGLGVFPVGHSPLPTCGGCGHPLSRQLVHHPHQEV